MSRRLECNNGIVQRARDQMVPWARWPESSQLRALLLLLREPVLRAQLHPPLGLHTRPDLRHHKLRRFEVAVRDQLHAVVQLTLDVAGDARAFQDARLGVVERAGAVKNATVIPDDPAMVMRLRQRSFASDQRNSERPFPILQIALLPGVVVHVRRLARLLHQLPQQLLRLLDASR